MISHWQCSPNIFLFVESELLEKLYVGEINKRILSPEMKAIVSMRETIGKDYLLEENLMLNKAEKISSVGLWTIRRMLAKDWTVESMQLWEQLRSLVLQYPTASTYDWQNNEYLQKLYITSGEKRNQYIYSQYSDFNDVTIDFGNDKVAFKNSKRAKIKGNSDEAAIYEMSEKESGLQAILRYGFGDAAYWMQLHEDMRKSGFYIKTVEESCERFAVIDQEVVWYGNINLLAKTKVDDSIMRVLSNEIAGELMKITFGNNDNKGVV